MLRKNPNYKNCNSSSFYINIDFDTILDNNDVETFKKIWIVSIENPEISKKIQSHKLFEKLKNMIV